MCVNVQPERFVSNMQALGVAVSRETLAALQAYVDMLTDWQTRMNLVGPATLPDVWQRHIFDSAQLLALAPDNATWLDVGSGAGFPALVLAIMGASHVHMVESTTKKCNFLAAVSDTLGLNALVSIHNSRIENLSPISTQFITARACAPLARLLGWVYPASDEKAQWFLFKGQDVDIELSAISQDWTYSLKRHTSKSDDRGCILELANIKPK